MSGSTPPPTRTRRAEPYPLSDFQRRLLAEQYDGRTETIDRLMRSFPGVPRWRVRRWAKQLGRCRAPDRPWQPEELAFLRRHIGTVSLDQMAAHLERTPAAVQRQASRLGLSKTGEGYTLSDLMTGLGVGNTRITGWVQQGWLGGRRRRSGRAEERDYWYFTDTAVREFVKAHPTEINPCRVDWLWLIDVLLGGDYGLGPLDGAVGEREEGAS